MSRWARIASSNPLSTIKTGRFQEAATYGRGGLFLLLSPFSHHAADRILSQRFVVPTNWSAVQEINARKFAERHYIRDGKNPPAFCLNEPKCFEMAKRPGNHLACGPDAARDCAPGQRQLHVISRSGLDSTFLCNHHQVFGDSLFYSS